MRSVGKNPGSVAADLVAEDQLQSYVGAETSLAQLRMLVLLHAGNPHERLHIDTQIEARSTDATSGVPALRRSVWAAVLLTSLALTGCQAAMTNPTRSSDSPNSVTPSSGKETSLAVIADWPLRFTAHDFDAFCYSTYGCKIKYGNYRRINDPEDQLKLSSASVGSKYPSNLSASYGPIRNFPPPAVVIWRSKDGTPLRAEIDMAQIFNDQLILHNLKREEISTKGSVPLPQIILEVNDRTESLITALMSYSCA